MSDAFVREARVADLPACGSVVNDYIDATDWLPRVLPRDRVAAMFEPGLLDRRRVWVAEEAGRVVGYVTLTEDGVLPALYLDPGARGRGLGKALLDQAKAVSTGGIELTVFEANLDALRFYGREGFVPVPGGRDTETDEGIATLRLRWPGDPA
jgi:GNAT superfamily N-acetyltransferase